MIPLMTCTLNRPSRIKAATRIVRTSRTLGISVSLCLGLPSASSGAGDAAIRVDPAKPLGRISGGLHGQFIEHLGTCVQGGIHPVADHLAIHFYFRTTDYPALRARVADFDRRIGEYADFLGSYPPQPANFPHWYRFPPRQGPVTLAIDEWGLWNGGNSGRQNLWGLNQTYVSWV